MEMPTRAAAHRLSTRVIVTGFVASSLLIAVLTGAFVWSDRQTSLERGRRTALQLALAVQVYTNRTLDEIAGLGHGLGQGRTAREREIAYAAHSASAPRDSFEYLVAVVTVDADGAVWSAGDSEATSGLRKLFDGTSPTQMRRPAFGPVFESSGPADKLISVAQVVTAHDGRLLHVLVAVRSDFLVRLHKALRVPERDLAVVVGPGGVLLARAPHRPELIGRSLAGSAILSAVPPSETRGTADVKTPTDGIDRLVGVSRSESFEFSAVGGFERARVLGVWQKRTLTYVAVALIAILALGSMSYVAYRRSQAAEELRRRVEMLDDMRRSTLQSLREGVLTMDRDGRIVDCNAAALVFLGLAEHELKGSSRQDPRWRFINEDGSAVPSSDFSSMRVLQTGVPVVGRLLGIFAADGSLRWALVGAVPLRDGEDITGIVISFVDVTEQRANAERLRQLNINLESLVEARTKEMRELTYTVAHDMRAPLRHIDAYVGMLDEDAADRLDEEQRRTLKQVREAVRRQAGLVDGLLGYVAAHQREPERVALDMNRLVQTARGEMLAIMPDAARVEWVIEPLPASLGDEAMMQEVLHHLLSNAVKFSANRPDPRVRIGPSVLDGAPAIAIEDNGVGFDMAYADKLFTLFQRFDGASERPGLGVGLALCKRLLEAQGSTIAARSVPAKGATFLFTVVEAGAPKSTAA